MNGKALAVLNPGSLVAWLLINNSYFKQTMSLNVCQKQNKSKTKYKNKTKNNVLDLKKKVNVVYL